MIFYRILPFQSKLYLLEILSGISNGNLQPMTAVATVVLREAGGGQIHSTTGSGLVPADSTATLSGTGFVPNEVATRADHWTVDVSWDLSSNPSEPPPTSEPVSDAVAPQPLRSGTPGLVAPVVIERVFPEYTPQEAAQKGLEGDVLIEAVITIDGTIDQPKLIQGIGDGQLNARALRALVRLRFEPGSKDGVPVPVIALFTITYKIE